jgi:hypothetical protein
VRLVARKPFLLRLDPTTLEALQVWAADELRSLNAQIEFLLRRSLRDAGRAPRESGSAQRSRAGRPKGES